MPELPEWFRDVAEYMLREGLPNTLKIAALAVTASTVVGLVLGTLITIRFRPLQALIRLYIEVWRGLPILVTVLFIYWSATAEVGGFRFELSAYMSVAIGLSLWGSAQVAEATRGAVQSIPREQHEAAAALGFGWVGRHAFVILPQALRRLLPPMVGLLVNIIQNSTLARVIGGLDVLEAGEIQNGRLSSYPPAGIGEIHAFEIFGGGAVLFFLIF